MTGMELLDQAQRLLFDEAAALDQRRWDDWLALYTPDCEFWVPAWKSEDAPTGDPGAEVSLVISKGREPISVPDVRQESEGAAEKTLTELGYTEAEQRSLQDNRVI